MKKESTGDGRNMRRMPCMNSTFHMIALGCQFYYAVQELINSRELAAVFFILAVVLQKALIRKEH